MKLLLCNSCDCPIVFEWGYYYMQILDIENEIVEVIFCTDCHWEEFGD